MACEDQITPQDLENAKTDAVTLGEVATSRAGATSSGDPITTSTNRFGETTDTIQGRLDKLGVIYANPIRDWTPNTVETQLEAVRYPAITGDVYVAKAPLPFTTDAEFNIANWNLYTGSIVVDGSIALVFESVATMQAGITVSGVAVSLSVGDRIKIESRANSEFICGLETANEFDIISTGTPTVTAQLIHNGDVYLEQLGATGLADGEDDSPYFNAAIAMVLPLVRSIKGNLKYHFLSQLTLRSFVDIDFSGASITMDDGPDSLFYAPPGINYFNIHGGEYILQNYVGATPVTSWFIGDGERVGTTNTYSQRYSIFNVRSSYFNWFMDCFYSRTWNLSDFFVRAYNGIKVDGKCVECNISDGLMFGVVKELSDNTRGLFIADTQTDSMYPEGLKMSKVTVDQFTVASEVQGALDLTISDCWLGTGGRDDGWNMKFTQGINNFFKGIHLTSNTYADGVFEFVDHATPVTTTMLNVNGGMYLGHSTMIIGQFWHDITIDGLVYRNNVASPIVGVLCKYNNDRINFKNMTFKGDFSTLINISSDSSKGCISNVWADEPIDAPFYLESPIRIVSSQQGSTVDLLGQKGQIVLIEQIPQGSYGYGADMYRKSLKLMPGSLVEVTVGGEFIGATSTGQVRIRSNHGELQEQGTGWSGEYLPVGDRMVGTYKLRYIVSTSSLQDLWIEVDSTSNVAAGYHTWVSVAYI